MLIFIRWIVRKFKRKREILTRYERSHPNFLWFLAIDAVLSVVLILGGYQLLFKNSSSPEGKEPSESSVYTSTSLTEKARNENLDVFWLGPVQGYKYSLSDQESGIVDIFYLPITAGGSKANNFLYEVKTYERLDVWNGHTHPLNASSGTTKITVTKNISIKISTSSMRGVIATFADKPEIVAIRYPEPQTLDNMIKNVESLKLLR